MLNGGDSACATFGGHRPLKILHGKKRPKFSTIYDRFRVWPQISLERMEISTSGKKRTIHRALNKENLVKFGPLTPEISRLMFTHPKWIVRVLRMLMHLCGGHVTLLPGGISPLLYFSPIGLKAPDGLTLNFAPNF